MEVVQKKQTHHFVLVHGLAHGAWCWYKLIPLLKAAGHQVTVVDLAGAGIHPKEIGRDVLTFQEYNQPLLEILAALPPNEKVVIVGHSLGGFNISLAADKFPDKISVAVFLTAFMPDTIHKASYVLSICFIAQGKVPEISIVFSEALWDFMERSSFDEDFPPMFSEKANNLLLPHMAVLQLGYAQRTFQGCLSVSSQLASSRF